MLQVCLELFGLPIAKLLVGLLVVERYCLIALVDLRSICFLLVALHDPNDGFVPRDILILRVDQVFPHAARLSIGCGNLEEDTIFGDKDQFWAFLANTLVQLSPGARTDQHNVEVFLPAQRIKKANYAGEIFAIRGEDPHVVQDDQTIFGSGCMPEHGSLAQHHEVRLRLVERSHQVMTRPEEGA